MIKGLYDIFYNAWLSGQHSGAIYLIGDPHFSDEGSLLLREANKKLPPNIHDILAYDAYILNSINSVVHKCDTLIILGDVGNKELVRQLKAGYKILIMGNHDSGASNYKPFFDEVYEGPLWIADRLLLSHEPISLPFALNIHGHDHSGIERQPNCFNVCAENINYKPVCLKHILASDLRKNIDSIHRITIDTATERSKKKVKNSKN